MVNTRFNQWRRTNDDLRQHKIKPGTLVKCKLPGGGYLLLSIENDGSFNLMAEHPEWEIGVNEHTEHFIMVGC